MEVKEVHFANENFFGVEWAGVVQVREVKCWVSISLLDFASRPFLSVSCSRARRQEFLIRIPLNDAGLKLDLLVPSVSDGRFRDHLQIIEPLIKEFMAEALPLYVAKKLTEIN